MILIPLQRNRADGPTSPSSDDSIGLDDGGLTHSITKYLVL